MTKKTTNGQTICRTILEDRKGTDQRIKKTGEEQPQTHQAVAKTRTFHGVARPRAARPLQVTVVENICWLGNMFPLGCKIMEAISIVRACICSCEFTRIWKKMLKTYALQMLTLTFRWVVMANFYLSFFVLCFPSFLH